MTTKRMPPSWNQLDYSKRRSIGRRSWMCVLIAGGLAAIEIGFDQAGPAAALFAAEGIATGLALDLADRPRALLIAP